MRIAMWSGPRNLSTAMMYSFAQRTDCTVIDEPFYAAYLAETGLDHPMRDHILASQPNDPRQVIANLAEPTQIPLRYEKHMTHHILPEWDLSWLSDVVNVFLVRHPARVIASYAAKRENPSIQD
ncbi:MAG: HAD family hydrolase, partial [Pseudomonadota bacterium]